MSEYYKYYYDNLKERKYIVKLKYNYN